MIWIRVLAQLIFISNILNNKFYECKNRKKRFKWTYIENSYIFKLLLKVVLKLSSKLCIWIKIKFITTLIQLKKESEYQTITTNCIN